MAKLHSSLCVPSFGKESSKTQIVSCLWTGEYVSLGWFEREDLAVWGSSKVFADSSHLWVYDSLWRGFLGRSKVVINCLRRLPNCGGQLRTFCQRFWSFLMFCPKSSPQGQIGLWGRSMGAATALMYSSRDPDLGALCFFLYCLSFFLFENIAPCRGTLFGLILCKPQTVSRGRIFFFGIAPVTEILAGVCTKQEHPTTRAIAEIEGLLSCQHQSELVLPFFENSKVPSWLVDAALAVARASVASQNPLALSKRNGVEVRLRVKALADFDIEDFGKHSRWLVVSMQCTSRTWYLCNMPNPGERQVP